MTKDQCSKYEIPHTAAELEAKYKPRYFFDAKSGYCSGWNVK